MTDNPYSPPSAELVQTPSVDYELATRGSRLLAAILDSILAMVIILPIMYVTDGFDKITHGEVYSLGYHLMMIVLGYIIFFLIHGKFLIANGQTVGKKAVGIRIADLDGNVPDFTRRIIPRYTFTTIISYIPIVGGLLSFVDSIMIFRKNRRCLHDLVAKTQVVKDHS